jgi:hypothetical protein
VSLNSQNTGISFVSVKSSLKFSETTLSAEATLSLKYDINILASSDDAVIVPTIADYLESNQIPIVTGNVTVYDDYWDLYLCGNFNTSNVNELQRIQLILTRLWSEKYSTIVNACQCLYVDIFVTLTQYYSDLSGQPVTRLLYLVYANSFELIIEKNKSSQFYSVGQQPDPNQIDAELTKEGFNSCRGLLPLPTFSITLCGILPTKDYSNLINELKAAWQSNHLIGGGINDGSEVENNVTILLMSQANSEFITYDE